jgi:hypothetical protein
MRTAWGEPFIQGVLIATEAQNVTPLPYQTMVSAAMKKARWREGAIGLDFVLHY